MSKSDQTAGDVFDSLTGHEERWIADQFGETINDLAENATMWARALIFIDLRRADVNDDDARNQALGLKLKDVTTYFAEPSEDDEESGKAEPAAEQSEPQPPATSLSSVI